MKGQLSIYSLSIFMVVVVILFLRPTIVFSSHLLQSSNYALQVETGAVAKTVRKHKSGVRLNNIICEDVEQIRLPNSSIDFWHVAIRKYLRTVSFSLSLLLCLFLFKIRRRSTFFGIVPVNHYYLALSVILI
jgi:hypothetical protein